MLSMLCNLLLQVAGLKDKLAVVLSKTQNDDKLIAALRKELVTATAGKAGSVRWVTTAQSSPHHPRSASTAQAEPARLAFCGELLRCVVSIQQVVAW
jgi:hypothetical protein